jgi:HSP20 family protein
MIEDAVTWVPVMDVYEIDDNYVLNAELPGVERRNVTIEFSGLKFTIRGERRFDRVCAEECYHRLEGHRGRFHRTFSLPEPVDARRVKLDLKEGVLHVVLPKRGGTKNPSSRGNR